MQKVASHRITYDLNTYSTIVPTFEDFFLWENGNPKDLDKYNDLISRKQQYDESMNSLSYDVYEKEKDIYQKEMQETSILLGAKEAHSLADLIAQYEKTYDTKDIESVWNVTRIGIQWHEHNQYQIINDIYKHHANTLVEITEGLLQLWNVCSDVGSWIENISVRGIQEAMKQLLKKVAKKKREQTEENYTDNFNIDAIGGASMIAMMLLTIPYYLGDKNNRMYYEQLEKYPYFTRSTGITGSRSFIAPLLTSEWLLTFFEVYGLIWENFNEYEDEYFPDKELTIWEKSLAKLHLMHEYGTPLIKKAAHGNSEASEEISISFDWPVLKELIPNIRKKIKSINEQDHKTTGCPFLRVRTGIPFMQSFVYTMMYQQWMLPGITDKDFYTFLRKNDLKKLQYYEYTQWYNPVTWLNQLKNFLFCLIPLAKKIKKAEDLDKVISGTLERLWNTLGAG